jgi:hypothetical protein
VWRATYRQEYISAGMTLGEEAHGVVWVAWPDRAHFREWSGPEESPIRWMAIEGRRFRLIDLEVPSCDDHVLDDEEWARIPLAAVLDPRGAIERFSIIELGGRGVILRPRDQGGLDRVEVVIGTDDGLPDEVVVVDVQGAVNHLWFDAWTAQDDPPDDGWLPRPPGGVTCIADDP